ncbi:MAG TPA: reactive intermediate/imine deaminase [Gammaproteobacteria bacterium]|jgi:reactive intermediate/imine deaminase|nr:reactive intermediate/imine deaminase [Gammaproteobacteria bacterium]
MSKKVFATDEAPSAIGTYSQAVQAGELVFISGQIPLVPQTMEVLDGSVDEQIRRVFDNIQAICQAAGGDLDDIVKLTVLLTDLADFPVVNAVMSDYFTEPYPARAAYGVAALPKDVPVEIEAIMQVCD